MTSRHTAAALAGFAALAMVQPSNLRSQTRDPARAAFDVASVKPNTSGDTRMRMGFAPGDRLTATNVTVFDLVRLAYQVQDFVIFGGPGWIKSDRFDIAARADKAYPPGPNGPPPELLAMLRTLLADRFGLRSHLETRDLPTYSLMIARSDGKPGAGLRPVDVDCEAILAARKGGPPSPPPPPPARGLLLQPAQLPPCGMLFGPGRLVGSAMSMTDLIRALSPTVGRIVTDRTGLNGRFQVALAFAPEQMPPSVPGAPDLPAIDPNSPTMFTALQEQLGLKLESAREPVEVLVIDSVDQPTPD